MKKIHSLKRGDAYLLCRPIMIRHERLLQHLSLTFYKKIKFLMTERLRIDFLANMPLISLIKLSQISISNDASIFYLYFFQQ